MGRLNEARAAIFTAHDDEARDAALIRYTAMIRENVLDGVYAVLDSIEARSGENLSRLEQVLLEWVRSELREEEPDLD